MPLPADSRFEQRDNEAFRAADTPSADGTVIEVDTPKLVTADIQREARKKHNDERIEVTDQSVQALCAGLTSRLELEGPAVQEQGAELSSKRSGAPSNLCTNGEVGDLGDLQGARQIRKILSLPIKRPLMAVDRTAIRSAFGPLTPQLTEQPRRRQSVPWLEILAILVISRRRRIRGQALTVPRMP